MLRFPMACASLAALIACSSPEDVSAELTDAQSEETSLEALERRTAASAEPMDFTDEESRGEAVREFGFKWPRQVSAIPELAAILAGRRDEALEQQRSEWEAALVEFAGMDCVTCVNRGYSEEWQVVANLPRFLSLSAQRYFYTGGAHGNSAFDTLVWDREAARALMPIDLFTGMDEFGPAIYPAYCSSLERQQRERRGEYFEGSQEAFGNCPGLDEVVMLLGSSNGQTFDRIGLLAAPYVAGPYAEGSYEVTLPVTPAVLATVRPEYRDAFALAE